MSQIFDALRKSEAERSGADLSALSEATELLRRAERNATTRWESADSVQQQNVTEIFARNTSAELLVMPLVETPGAPPDRDEPTIVEEPLSAFDQFGSLQVSASPESALVCLTDQESPAAEAFRLLGVRLRDIRRERPLKKVLITSTIPQEGKSMVAANLSSTLAQTTEQKVLLLEGDLRRPSLSRMFGVGNNPGICEWLQDELSLDAIVYRLENAGFWIMPAGNAPENMPELLQSERLVALMEKLTAWFDWIIIDSPPVLPLADTSVWTNLADGILLVTRQGTTEKRQLKRGLDAIDPQKVIGALVNGSNNLPHSDYYYSPSRSSHSRRSETE